MLTVTECQAWCCHFNQSTAHIFFLSDVEKGKNKTNDLDEMLCFWSVSQVSQVGYTVAQRKINIIISEGMNLLKSLRLHESDRRYLCSSIKGWAVIRLISILMNANWHICYGGLAVQTLQLAWLINYPRAHWKWRLWNELSGGWKNGFKRKKEKRSRKH